MPATLIGPVDLVVLCLYVVCAVALGLWIGRGQRSLDAYLLGDRNVSWWVILGSIVATETSTATFLSVPGIAYAREGGDLRFLQLTFGYILGRLLIVVLFLPGYFRGELFSAYEVLQSRFGGTTRTLASLIFLFTRNLGDGLRLFLTAIALEQVLGWSLPACVVVIGVATIIYTVFGGMKSVIWNDCLQMLIYLAGGLFALFFLVGRLEDGWQTLIEFGQANDKFRLLDFRQLLSEPFTFWAGVIGGMFLTLGTHGTDQMMVQRYLCARSRADAARAVVASGFCVFLQFALFLLLGVGLACFYQLVQPDRTFERSDRVFATFIVEELPTNVGIVGLLLAAVLAAAMSTLSSSLNSSATAVVNDFVVPRHATKLSDERLVRISRIWTVVFGLIQIGIGIAAQQLQGPVVSAALAVAGFSAGLLLGVFALGLTRRVNQQACLLGLAGGLVMLVLVRFGLPYLLTAIAEFPAAQPFLERYFGSQYALAWPWLPVVAAVSTFTIGWLASFLSTSGTPSERK